MDNRLLCSVCFTLAGLALDAARGQAPVLPRDLPGVLGSNGTVGVTNFSGGLGTIDDLATAGAVIERIKDGRLAPDVVASGQYRLTDFTDPDTHSAGGPIIDRGVPMAFPGNTPGDDDDFLSIARGVVMVPETGTYTIQVRSDEGMGLRMIGTPFRSVHGRGQLDLDGAMIHPQGTDDTDSRGVIDLLAGPHEFEFLMWERDGSAYWEITSAQGVHPHEDSARWLAFGDSSVLPSLGGLPRAVTLASPARVVNLTAEEGGAVTDIISAREAILDAQARGAGITRDDVTTIVLDDHDGICCRRPGAWVRAVNQSFRWPLNHSPSGGEEEIDFDDFSSGLFGTLQVDDGDQMLGESQLLTFAMLSSDGSQFHILGQSFTDHNIDEALSMEIDGDTVLTFPDGVTGNSNTLGLIELQEGVIYEWEAFHFERRYDAGFEIWAALGNQLDVDATDTERFLQTFFPLSGSLDELVVPGNRGFRFVLRGDYNADGILAADDLELQSAAIASRQHPSTYDLNHDGLVDLADRLEWIEHPTMKNSYVGDANLDGLFDASDLVQVFVAGKYETSQSAVWAEGDWNADRVFDSLDFVTALSRGGYELGPRNGGLQAVPEPNGLSWLSVVLPWCVCARRRRSRAFGPRNDQPTFAPYNL